MALLFQLAPGERAGGVEDLTFATAWPDGERVAVLIDVRDDLRPEEREAVRALLPREARATSAHAEGWGLYRVELPVEEAMALADRLAGDPRVRTVEPEMTVELEPAGALTSPRVQTAAPSDAGPNDPLYPFQWNFRQVNAEDAWQRARGDGVIVAVIDTGVAYADDPALGVRRIRDFEGTRFVPGYDFVDRNAEPFDLHGHGTHVAGTIAQTTGNDYGVAGLAPGAAIMPIRVLDEQGRGATGDIADAIRFAADNGAHIINMSLGGPLPSRVMADAVAHARRKGVVVIAAAGNNGWSMPSFPAAYRGVIAVAATQYDRTTTFYSNYGQYIDIAAPGGNTRVDQVGDGRPDGILQETLARGNPSDHEFALYMGTSMAAPHVAAVAALIRSQGVTHPDRIEELLLSSASRDVPVFEQDRYGAGLVDAGRATTAALSSWHAPRIPLALFAALLALGLARGRQGLRPLSAVAFTASSLVMATGLAGPALLMIALGIQPPTPAALETGVLHWAHNLGGTPWITTNLLLLSALPVLLLYGLFGSTRGPVRSGLLLGTMAGVSIFLVSEALIPLHDVTGIPGFGGIADRLWLALNGVLGLTATAIASRRDV
ncbi:MAG: peptidase S8 [Deltaproteobacteria bacterium]|nr:MAG: peptidase S8 [Deltaproteobacteria bacterium]